MIQAVLFDIDNTLYDYDAAHAVAWRVLTAQAQAALGLAPDRFAALHRQADGLLRQRTGGGAAIHNRLLRCQLMLELAGLPVRHAPAMAKLYWTALLDAMVPAPGARQTLSRLRDAGQTIGIGTNMTADWQYAKLERLGLMPLVDFIVTSEEAGAEKPDGRLFALCAEKAGCAPAKCAFVGDSLKGDALGARDAGMAALWLRHDPGEPAPDGVLAIHSLDELPDLIHSL